MQMASSFASADVVVVLLRIIQKVHWHFICFCLLIASDQGLSRKSKFHIGKTMSHLVESKICCKRDDTANVFGLESAGGHAISHASAHLKQEKLVEAENGHCFLQVRTTRHLRRRLLLLLETTPFALNVVVRDHALRSDVKTAETKRWIAPTGHCHEPSLSFRKTSTFKQCSRQPCCKQRLAATLVRQSFCWHFRC